MTGEEKTATAEGFGGGEITVKATIDNGTITALEVNADTQTPGFGQRCAEDKDFLNQFIGKSIPLELGKDVDALSGATVTSEAIVTALNSLNTPDIGGIPEDEQKPVVTGEEKTATAEGFGGGEITVKATIDNNTITALEVNTDTQTPGFGQRCAEDEDFLKQFIGKTLPLEAGKDVDVLSGATVTSEAIVTALNTLAAPAEEAATATDLPAGEEKTATAEGFGGGEITVKATIDNNTITALEVNADTQTPGFGQRCAEDEAFLSQFIGKTLPLEAGKDVDVLSGATITSEAIVTALNSLAQ